MELKLQDGKKTLQVSEAVFGRDYNETLVHQAVVAYMAGGRAGTKAQKSRSDVRGGGIKPWRQKGTGRARAGTIRSPLWRTGGVTFAARPRDHSQKMNKKMYRGAMRAIFSELARQDRLILVDEFKLEAPKTKMLVAKLKDLSLDNVLILSEAVDENVYLAARNLINVQVLEANAADPVSLVRFDKVLLTVAAAKQVEGWLS